MASTWFGMERRLRFTMLRLFLFASFIGVVLAGEWNCAATSGVFTRTANCAPMSGELVVDGDLSITGNEDTYTTLVAATDQRHFSVNGAHTLTLVWLNMTGGSPATSHGGSI